MVELLAERKRTLLRECGVVTAEDFEVAWEASWTQMVAERAWPHATVHRRQWRRAMEEAMMPEARACWLGQPTAFSEYVTAIFALVDESRDARTPSVTGVRRSGRDMRGVSIDDGRAAAVA